jgi:hypothetical protein
MEQTKSTSNRSDKSTGAVKSSRLLLLFERCENLKDKYQALTPLVILLLLGGIWATLYFLPMDKFSYPPCPFHYLTGWYCAGCGSLRGITCLAHGDIAGAFSKNPLMVICVPFIGYWLLAISVKSLGRKMPLPFIPAFWIWLLLGAIIAYWIIRNIPFYPFTLLAPS